MANTSLDITHDHADHIVRTSRQWDETAAANYPIPRGVLCVELTPTNHTRLKVGVGDKFYRQLPYIDGDAELSNYYTKEEVNTIIANLNYMSIASTTVYPSINDLPKAGNRLGDLRFVKNPNPKLTDPVEYIYNGTNWIPLGGICDIDLSEYAKKSEVNPRLDSLEHASHTHANKQILDGITASYTKEEKKKLAGLENYDDTGLKTRVSDLEIKAHTHPNKETLDLITAPYTREEKTKLAGLENYEDFVGTDGTEDGTHGLVPAPSTTDTDKFLSSDGTWKTVEGGGYELPPATDETLGGIIVGENLSIDENGVLSADAQQYTLPIASDSTLGGIKVGSGLEIDQNGVLSTTGGGGTEYTAGTGIAFEETHSDYDTSSPYYFDGTTMCTINGRSYWRPNSSDGHPCYAWISRDTNGWVGPFVVSKNQDDVICNWTGGTEQWLSTVTYNDEIWHVSKNAWWQNGTVTSTNIYWPFESGGSEESDTATVVIRMLSQMHPSGSSETAITNTGVLDVTKDNNGDLVVSKTTGDTTLQLDHYTLPTASSNTLGGIKVGSNLSIDANGVLSATGGGGTEYVAGEGISIDEGSSTTDITSLQWEQGSIASNGLDDDTDDQVVRSPFIDVGLTDMINLSATASDDTEMLWKLAFYDSNEDFISMSSAWNTLADGEVVPNGAYYVRIMLTKNPATTIDENSVGYVEISYPVEVGKYVITNTGVTHLEMNGNTLLSVENSETNPIIDFTDTFVVQNGSVDINPLNRIILNVENLES